MRVRNKEEPQGTFYLVNSSDHGDYAQPMDLIPLEPGTKCDFCEGSSGVFFRDRGHVMGLAEPMKIADMSPQVRCYNCMGLSQDEPALMVMRRGQTRRTWRSIIVLAKNREDLRLQFQLWKSGHKLLRAVSTKYGEVAVLSKNAPTAENCAIRCPHCKKSIELTVAAQSDIV